MTRLTKHRLFWPAVCLATPDPFYAVGVHYLDFDQVTDDAVSALLARSAARLKEHV